MKVFVRKALHRVGVDLVRYNGRHFVARRRVDVIRSTGTTVVIDVGAGSGQFVGWLRDAGYDGRIVSFEPVADAFARVQGRAMDDPALSCYRIALGDRDGEAVIHRAANIWSSSLLPMTDRQEAAAPESAYVAEETVPLARLDSLDVVRTEDRVYLKIDVQGAEAAVLEGATGVLERVVAIEVELSLVELYKGQQLLPALYERLRSEGFALVWLGDAVFRDRDSDEILTLDGIFVRYRRA
jgi:FkbM family methyltransferase